MATLIDVDAKLTTLLVKFTAEVTDLKTKLATAEAAQAAAVVDQAKVDELDKKLTDAIASLSS